MHSYRISGLSVLSEIPLPGLLAAADDSPSADVTIRCAAVPAVLDGAALSTPTWQIAGDRFLLHYDGIARFLLQGGREISVEPDANVTPGELAIFLIGTVFGILLHQRGQSVLHASAVGVGGRAVLFCGPSGTGKSTIAAALVQRGYPMVTDDVCALSIGPGGLPVVEPDGRLLKLWAHAIDKLALAAQRGAAVRKELEKFYVEPHGACAAALPLGAIYILRETRRPLVDGIQKPNFVDASILIRKNAYRPRLVTAMEQSAAYLQLAAAAINKGGIFFLTRPLDFAAMPVVIERLEKHWREIGILGDRR